MRNLRALDMFRDTSNAVVDYWGSIGDEKCGLFWVHSIVDSKPMKIIASNADGWDHVSVSREKRCPNWPEMSQIRRIFFRDSETVMQLHVPLDEHINNNPYCLHLWRPHHLQIPRPPSEFV